MQRRGRDRQLPLSAGADGIVTDPLAFLIGGLAILGVTEARIRSVEAKAATKDTVDAQFNTVEAKLNDVEGQVERVANEMGSLNDWLRKG